MARGPIPVPQCEDLPVGMLRYVDGRMAGARYDVELMLEHGWGIPALPKTFTGDVPFMAALATPHRLGLLAALPSSVRHTRSTADLAGEAPFIAVWSRIHLALKDAVDTMAGVFEPVATPQGKWDMTLDQVLQVPEFLPGWLGAAEVALAASGPKLGAPAPKGGVLGWGHSVEVAFPLIQTVLRSLPTGAALAHCLDGR